MKTMKLMCVTPNLSCGAPFSTGVSVYNLFLSLGILVDKNYNA